jgi:predicted nucleic acid-binding protein
MRRYFIDTWYVIALADHNDSHHRQAKRINAAMSGALLVTHEAVLTEFLTYFAEGGPRSRSQALSLARQVLRRNDCRVARSSDLFSAAVDFYSRRLDKAYSLVDCMSMVLMKQQKITHVLTNDHHFRQEGFTVVNE